MSTRRSTEEGHALVTVTDAEYHLTFGLHSGIPLCCAHHFAYVERRGGPCPVCSEKGITKAEVFAKYHHCEENEPSCQPYLDHIDGMALDSYREYIGKNPEALEYGTHSHRVLDQRLRDALRADGFRMTHICWPEYGYWYIFQRDGSPKAQCGICSKKFSLKFPTAGTQSRKGPSATGARK